MQRKHALIAALGFLTLLGTVQVAEARAVTFGGTRGQVAAACTGVGRSLSEGIDGRGLGWTRCVDVIRNTMVECDSTFHCAGSFSSRSGVFGGSGLPRPRGNFVPPESIIDQNGDYVAEEAPQDVPRGGKPSGDIIN